MTADIENLMLGQFRLLLEDIDELKAGMAELKLRMTSLETAMASVKYETAACFDTDDRQQFALDRLSIRSIVERIERRLDLQD